MTIDFLSFNPDGEAYFWRISILNEDTRQVTAPLSLAIQFCCLIKKNPVFRSTRAGEKARTVFCFQPAGSQPCFLPTLKRLLGLAASTVFSGNLSSFSWVVLLNHWKSSGQAPVRVQVLFDDFTCSLWALLLHFYKQKPNPLTASSTHIWSEDGGAGGWESHCYPHCLFKVNLRRISTTESCWWLPWKTLPQEHLQSVKKWVPECLANEAGDNLEEKWSSVGQTVGPRIPELPLKGGLSALSVAWWRKTALDLRRVYLLYLCGHLQKTPSASWQVTKTCAHLFLSSFGHPTPAQEEKQLQGFRCPETCDRRNSNWPAFPLHSTLRLHEIKNNHNRVVAFVYVLENDILKGQLQAVRTLSKLVFATELLTIEGQLLTKRPWDSWVK